MIVGFCWFVIVLAFAAAIWMEMPKKVVVPSMSYSPQPFDASDLVLGEELEGLIISLGEKVHDAWARKRIDQGWVFGPARNDKLKHHPCLIPYADLTESEKDLDLAVIREVVSNLAGDCDLPFAVIPLNSHN
ncbi:MAG: hypothetical protein UT24_C0033G0010 [Candidatus Woesebacteria bacterium GW2011_GWB1_39_12]|uniref:Ryanodine receptor Ryr domain-containing protein n=1 Tax=Candidatus Woesebacteria bacterium GW2011_GWB1_39_12 TaxID=1618574 RepID=A0A0G0MET9_9BACT|nr:MAG: hypothetical protein UT24_C0033G0010 [Candidatus Woesebacteria bacterium GW2011_GWB1_39_12]